MSGNHIDQKSPPSWTGERASQQDEGLPSGLGELARLAADIFGAPLASIVLSDWSESWFTSGALPLRDLPHDPFLEHTLTSSEVLEFRDTDGDRRFHALGSELHAAGVRSYAGCALRSGGEAIGAIAIYRTDAVALSARERGVLAALARQGAMLAGLHSRVTELELLSTTEHGAVPAGSSRAFALADSLLDCAPVAIYYADTQSELTYVNPEYRRMFALAPTQSVDDWPNAVHPADRDGMKRCWADFLRNPRAVEFEYRVSGDDGAMRYYAERVTPTQGISGYVGTISDITDLVNARTLLEAVIGDLPVALVACDAEGRTTRYNRAAVDLYGSEPSDPARIAEIFLMDGVTPVPPQDFPLARALRGEPVTNLELVVVPPDAPPRSTLSSVRRLADPDGRTLGAVAVIQDTTERKRRELELERVHRELVTASREAGMAEVATNVLHNVGNILNSVNISANLLAERLKQSKAAGVSRLAALLAEHAGDPGKFLTDDARGRRVPEYLAALGEQLVTDQRDALAELTLLRENLEHIKDTVMMQQSYAKLCGVVETVEVPALVEDSLRLNASAFVRHGVRLVREIGAVPPIAVDKHKVLQILVNLVRNAKYACDESGRPDKLITLRVEPSARGVSISVIDNGVGIPAENMHKLFRHGFTTRKSGHGFGLHSGALAAREIGGTLRAESAGPGLGAAFILDLPPAPPLAPVADARRSAARSEH